MRLLPILFLALAGCATTQCPPPAIQEHVVTKTVTVQKPCVATVPVRPAKLGTLPTDAVQLAAVLAEALAQYSAPGQWADQAQAALARCSTP